MKNPYLCNDGEVLPEIRVGRALEVEKACGLLGVPHGGRPQCVAIHGPRWIGKTTLLRCLREQCAAQQRTTAPLVVYMPLSKSRGKDTADFLSDFFRLLKDCVPDVEKTCTEKTDLRGLEAAVKAVTAGGRALILMLDDLDALLDNSRFTVDFFNFLRDLAQQYRVAYVTTTPRRLWGWFTHQGPFSGSSFANIFPGPLPLGPFTKDEARDLITRPSQRAGASLEGDINALEYLAGRFPFFLQVACHLFFELRSQTPNAGDKEIEAVAGRYGELMKDWLNMIWEQDFTQEEREVCRLLVQKERVPNELQEPLSGLADLGYAQQREDGTFRLVPAVWRHFVRRKLSLPHPHKGGFFSVLMNIFHGQPPPRREQ